MKKLLYFNTAIGSENLGDYVIMESVQSQMADFNRKSFVIELPSHTKTYNFMQKFFARGMIKSYKEADYKFLCGTNALYTSMLRPNPNWKVSLFDMSLQKDTILLGVGSGVNSKHVDSYTKLLWRKILRKDIAHSVRDIKTKEFLEKLGLESIYTGCPTTWGFTPEFLSKIPKKKAEGVLFTLTFYNKNEEFDAKMIEMLLNKYEKSYFFPQCYGDYSYFNALTTEEQKAKIEILGGNLSCLNDVLNKEDIDYVGSRLHCGMYSLQHKKRTIVIAIDHRARNMLCDSNIVFERDEKCLGQIGNRIEDNFNIKMDIPLDNVKLWKDQFKV